MTAVQIDESELFDLLCYLASAADLVTGEPELYPSFRLLDGMSRLLGAMVPAAEGERAQFYAELKARIDEDKMQMVFDKPGFLRFLPELTETLADEGRRRDGAA